MKAVLPWRQAGDPPSETNTALTSQILPSALLSGPGVLEDGQGPGHGPQAGVVQAAERPPGQGGEGEGGQCQTEEREVVCSHLTGRTLTDGHTSLPSSALLQYYSRPLTSLGVSTALHNTLN